MSFENISENLRVVNEKIDAALAKTGRSRESLTLIGVTKTIDLDRIRELVRLGVTQLGENRVQELLQKHGQEGFDNVSWHMIGQLQTNKVRQVVGKVSLIHSVDSLKLAQEIDKESKKRGIVSDILIEVNIAKEETKGGVLPELAKLLVKDALELANINIKGLMTVAPYVENPRMNEKYFEKMNELLVDMNENIVHNNSMVILSMGMTNDYEIAIEKGSTIVRLGSAIFGERYKNT